ncbi:MAG: hypothetical protein ACYDHZ_08375, partial [Dehalococcoidia bacterium]
MRTEEGLLIIAVVVLFILLALSVILNWYRFRIADNKDGGKRMPGKPAPASSAEKQVGETSEQVLRAALSGVQDGIL